LGIAGDVMETYPVDIAAEQIVQWLIAEQASARRELEISASRSYTLEDISSSDRRRRRLGEEEIDDITEVTAIGTLDVTPLHSPQGWVLRVRIEDALGERLPDDEPFPAEPEEIDLRTFQEQFIERASGAEFVSVDAETPQAWQLCKKLLAEIEGNRHEI